MKSLKHTPVWCVYYPPNMTHAAQVNTGRELITKPIEPSIARLIAAAPELLVVLRDFMSAYEHRAANPEALDSRVTRFEADSYELARKALAKATGGVS